MPWTAPFTAVPGQMMTAALWNVQVRDNLNVVKTPIADDGRLNGEIRTYREAVNLPAIVAGTVTLDLTAANTFTVNLTANVTLAVSGWPAGKATTATVRLLQDATGGRTIAIPATWKWAGGLAPAFTTRAAASDILALYSDDGGATVFAAMVTQNA